MTSGRTRTTIVRLAVVAAAGISLVACGGSDNGAAGGGDATRAEFTAADGTSMTLADMKGSPVVVNMWATWCKPCVKEMPAFDQVAASIDGVRIVGVNVADEAADAAKFAADLGVAYEQFTDPTGSLSDAFGVTGLPATAFIAADGTVVEVHSGALTADELTARIAADFPKASS
ncbi:MAG: TlpA family protein disulfide reductase [Ilumatobacteraceae bacterium]